MKIEKGHPMPTKTKHQSFKWPFAEMEVGDSFTFDSIYCRQCASSAVRYAKKYGGTFTVRNQGDHHRCWRTS